MKRGLTFLIVLTFLVVNGFAQDFSSKSKKAVKKYKAAISHYEAKQFDAAIGQIQNALKADANFIEAYLLKAQIHIDKKEKEKAIEAYRQVRQLNPRFFPRAMMFLAQLEFELAKYEESLADINLFIKMKIMSKRDAQKANLIKESCEFSIESMKNPVPFNPVEIKGDVNSVRDEYWPSLSLDEKYMIYTSRVILDEKKDFSIYNSHEDFFASEFIDGKWQEARSLGENINTVHHEGAQSWSVDGNTMYYTFCSSRPGGGKCDIFVSYKEEDEWLRGANIGRPVNSRNSEKQPSLSPDGQVLYFVSDRLGGKGGMDIWFSELTPQGLWGTPINMKSINTSEDESSPFIHPDNQTLYFASDGHPGLGQHDLFMIRKQKDGTWGEVENLGYPINTWKNEEGLFVNAKGEKAYYFSDAVIERGFDIYEFELDPKIQPNPVSYMKGIVEDEETKKKLMADFELIDLDSKTQIMKAKSDYKNGDFTVCLPANRDYALNVAKDGYLFHSENFSFKGEFSQTEPFHKNILLKPIRVGESIVLKNIFYETNSFELKEKSTVELHKLIEFMKQNPTIIVEIGGHTDNVGSHDYNMDLSKNRAKSVVDYLTANGVKKERLSFRGYGEDQPVAENTTDEGRAQNRRTEFKIIGKQ